jgi:Ca2+-binding RTX toxin-like protein
MTPERHNRMKAMAALFATISLFVVRGGHAAPAVTPPCTITGTPGADLLFGTKGRDVICGLGGDDVLDGNGGNDGLYGGAGDDLLNGGNGNDLLYGGAGNDKLQGDHGRDTMRGGAGNDMLFAWDGFADKLNGGPGADRAWKDKYDRATAIERFS